MFKRLKELYGNSFTDPKVFSNWVVMREGVADSEMAKSESEYFNDHPVLPFDEFGSVDKIFEDGETSCENYEHVKSTVKWYETYFEKRNRNAMKRLSTYRKKHKMPNVYLTVGDNHVLPIANNPIYNLLATERSAWLVRPFKQFYSDDCQSFLSERHEVFRETCNSNDLQVYQIGSRILKHKTLAQKYPKNLQAQISYASALDRWAKYNIELFMGTLDQESQDMIIDTINQYKKVQTLYPSDEIFEKKWAFVDWVAKQSHLFNNERCRKKILKEAKNRDKEYSYYKKTLGPNLIDKTKKPPLTSKELKALL